MTLFITCSSPDTSMHQQYQQAASMSIIFPFPKNVNSIIINSAFHITRVKELKEYKESRNDATKFHRMRRLDNTAWVSQFQVFYIVLVPADCLSLSSQSLMKILVQLFHSQGKFIFKVCRWVTHTHTHTDKPVLMVILGFAYYCCWLFEKHLDTFYYTFYYTCGWRHVVVLRQLRFGWL